MMCLRRYCLWMLLFSGLTVPAAAAPADRQGPAEGEQPVAAAQAGAQQASKAGPDAAADGPADELLIFEEIPQVVTVSRQPQEVNWLSAPVSLVTSETIRYSGRTTIPELLQFVSGVDVLKISNGRYNVGIRGLHSTYSDQTLVLIDGRVAMNPLYGGSELVRMPILLEDIDHIEVVRAPIGGTWGANAFNGVINIITKEPAKANSLLTFTVDHRGGIYSQARWSSSAERLSWYVSAGWAKHNESNEKIFNPYAGSVVDVNDHSRDARLFSRGRYELSEDAEVDFGLGFSQIDRGDAALGGVDHGQNEHHSTLRSWVRLSGRYDKTTSGYIQFLGAFSDLHYPQTHRSRNYENDLEAQLTFQPAENHEMAVGGNLRWVHLNMIHSKPTDATWVSEDPYNEYWAGLYVTDRWQVTPRLVIEGQGRVDFYSGTQTDWAARISAMYALDEQLHHVVRISGARAFRTPLLGIREAQIRRYPILDTPLLSLAANDDLTNESVWSAELGYRGRLSEQLAVSLEGYYMEYKDMIGIQVTSSPHPILGAGTPVFRFTPTSMGTAQAFGGEAQVELNLKALRLTGWYNFQQIDTGEALRGSLPAHHKAGLTALAKLPDGWAIQCAYKASSSADSGATNRSDAPSFHILDFSVSKTLFDGAAQLHVGVNDVLDKSGDPARSVETLIPAHETPGRTFFVKMIWEF